MGSLGAGWGDKSSSEKSYRNEKSGTRASELSNAQLGILQNRENQFNNFFFPQMQSAINTETAGSQEFNARMGQQANKINTAYGAAQKATEQSLARQGIVDGGVAASLKAANERARASSLASAYADTLANASTNKMKLLNTMAAMMPTPTNAATFYQDSTSESKSKGSSRGIDGSFNTNASSLL